MQKPKSVFGLHIRGRIACEPIPKSAQCNPKFIEKTNIYKTHYFLLKIREKSRKLPPKGVQKGDFETGVAPLGAPFFEAVFGTQFFTQKSHMLSKMTQKVTNLKVFREPF